MYYQLHSHACADLFSYIIRYPDMFPYLFSYVFNHSPVGFPDVLICCGIYARTYSIYSHMYSRIPK